MANTIDKAQLGNGTATATAAGGAGLWRRVKGYATSSAFIGFVAAVAVMAAIALAFFWPDAMNGGELRQHDTLQGLAIGHEAEQWRQATGETPRWTNSLFCGMPTFQIAPRYAAGEAITAMRDACGLWLPAPSNLLFMMMLGFFVLLLAMRVSWWMALLGAVAYGLSSYFVIIIGAGHIWKFYTLAFVPPTLAGIVLAYRGRYLAGGALAALAAMLQIAGNHVQMSYYFLMVVAGLAVAYGAALWRARAMRQWAKATGVLAVAALLAVAANLPNLYHTYKYSKQTMRGQHSELTAPEAGAGKGLDKDYITAWSYGLDETFTLLIPNVKGGATIKPEAGGNKLLTLADAAPAAKLTANGTIGSDIAPYLGQMPQYFGDQPMTNGPVYVGAIVLALFLLGCIVVRGPLKWVLLGCTLLSVALAWGHNMMWLTDLMIDHFPLYNRFRTVASILVVAELTIPLLAVLALREVVGNRERWRERYEKPFCAAFGACALLCLAGVAVPELYGSFLSEQEAAAYGSYLAEEPYARLFAAVERVRMDMVKADALRSLLLVAGGGALLWLYGRRRLNATVLAVGLIALVAADLYTVDKRYLDHDSFVARRMAQGEPFALSAADRQILADTAMNYRVMDLARFSEAAPSYRHKAVGGYHAAKLTRFQDLIDRHLGHFISGQATEADMNVLNMLNAKYIVAGDEVVENPGALGNAWLVDRVVYADGAAAEMAALDTINPRATAVADRSFAATLGGDIAPRAATDTIYETSYAPDRLAYRAVSAGGGVAVFSEVFFPWGWTATIDGAEAPIGRVNYLLRALRVPAGAHDVVMTFRPASVRATGIVAVSAVAIIYLAAAAALLFGLISLPARGKNQKAA